MTILHIVPLFIWLYLKKEKKKRKKYCTYPDHSSPSTSHTTISAVLACPAAQNMKVIITHCMGEVEEHDEAAKEN